VLLGVLLLITGGVQSHYFKEYQHVDMRVY